MSYKLHVSNSIISSLIEHADNSLPLESVALLFGVIEEDNFFVSEVHCVPNAANSSTTFFVEPELQYRLMMDAESRGFTMVGIFHSHPSKSPTFPSTTDLKNMMLNPVVWIVASKQPSSWSYAAFLYINEEIIEVEIVC
jgi:proteasome lid subunit RPN8/RPN11